MFLSNAYLKIGRVPILYLPFFFYPGSRLALNPAFGFNSARGLFASATIELFCIYSSFTEDSEESSLLKSEDSKNLVSNGLYYDKSDKEESSFDKWVKKNGNYFTLLFDAYEKFGLHLGYDLLIKSDKFKILSKSGLAYTNPNNNIDNKDTHTPPCGGESADDAFERLWALYPQARMQSFFRRTTRTPSFPLQLTFMQPACRW